ncbi:MAG: hypothetical protein ACJAZN_001047 [Planctomycetota bacterium]|jgi:hypothetical protein
MHSPRPQQARRACPPVQTLASRWSQHERPSPPAVQDEVSGHQLGRVRAGLRPTGASVVACYSSSMTSPGVLRGRWCLNRPSGGRPPRLAIIKKVSRPICSVTADAAYDTRPIYDAAEAKGADVVVPPSSTARTSTRRRRSTARNRTVRRVGEIGRRQWQKESGCHRQGRVESAFYRYKAIFGGHLRARVRGAQETEAVLACNALNRMRELGWPNSVKIARRLSWGREI